MTHPGCRRVTDFHFHIELVPVRCFISKKHHILTVQTKMFCFPVLLFLKTLESMDPWYITFRFLVAS